MVKQKKVRPKPDRKFDASYYVEAYRLAKSGLSDKEIARAVGVTGLTFRRWRRKKPAFDKALTLGREKDPPQAGLEGYLYEKLSPELKSLWKEIYELRKEEGGVARVKELLDDKGVRVRQHLFLHALVKSNFNESQALKWTCTPKKVYDYWRDKDPEFEHLVKEMVWHKQNWYINHFNEGVEAGSEALLLHAMKTFCKDRGYGEKTEVEVKHDHVHEVRATFDFEAIAPYLDVDTKRKILAAVESAHKALPPHEGEIEDAEFTVKEDD